jgi:hypothetical protein
LRNRFPRQGAAPGNRPAGRAGGLIVLALATRSRLDVIGLGEPTMQPRESAPLWVGLTFVLMLVGTVMYVAGYFMVEDLLVFLKR